MRIRLFTPVSIIFLVLILSLAGCKKDFDKIKAPVWKPDLAIPLVIDNITFEQALKETGTEKNFYIDDAGDISMLYYFNDNAFRIVPSDLITLPSFPFTYDHIVTAAEQQQVSTQDLTLAPVTYTINLTESLPGIRIDKLLVKEGSMVVSMDNTFNNGGHLVLSFLNATKNGVPFIYTTGPFASGSYTETIDLSNVLFDLTTSPGLVQVQVQAMLKQSSRPVANDRIHAGLNLSIRKIGRFVGYLGQHTFTPDESFVKLSVFHNDYVLGDVHFEDPQVSITMVNSIGIPLRVTVTDLKATNSTSVVGMDITSYLGSNAVFSVPSPDINATVPATTTMNYTNANTGNIMDLLFNIKPDRIHYTVKTEINPSKAGINFFSDTSSVYANLMVKLPLYGHFDHLTAQDTFAFSLNKEKEIESVNFKTFITNGLPLQARMQVYFVDKLYRVIDSLAGYNAIFIKEAPVDPATHLPKPGMFGEKDTSFFFDRARMESISNAEYILVRAVMNSFDEGSTNVKIRSTQALKLNFAAEVKLIKNLGSGK